MDCPLCHQSTSVVEKRGEVAADRRRRECVGCGHRFTTYEIRAGELESLRSAKHKLDQLTEQLTDLLSPKGDLGDTQPAALDVGISR